MRHILAADIGATHSRFAVFSLPDGAEPSDRASRLSLLAKHWFATQEHGSFAALLAAVTEHFLAAGFSTFDRVCLAVPGPVADGRCVAPNITWDLDVTAIREVFRTEKAWMLNDFVALGHACALLQAPGNPLEAEERAGKKAVESPRSLAIVGAGTGFGKAVLLHDPHCVLPSEGGHADFPFQGEEEHAFSRFVTKGAGWKNGDSVEIEHVVSGGGLCRILSYHGGRSLSSQEATAFLTSPEGRRDAAAQKTLEWFARFYGRVCKNFLLETLADGGLCVAGGLASYLPVLEQRAFFDALHESPTHRTLLENVPVYHVTNREAGLWGAGWYAALRWE